MSVNVIVRESKKTKTNMKKKISGGVRGAEGLGEKIRERKKKINNRYKKQWPTVEM